MSGKLGSGLGKAVGQFEEKAASLVLFVLKVQGERQAVLQLGSEILDLPVLHAFEPAGKVVHKGFGLVGRSFQGAQEEGYAAVELIACLAHTVKDDVQPDGQSGLGFAQTQGKFRIVEVCHGSGRLLFLFAVLLPVLGHEGCAQINNDLVLAALFCLLAGILHGLLRSLLFLHSCGRRSLLFDTGLFR